MKAYQYLLLSFFPLLISGCIAQSPGIQWPLEVPYSEGGIILYQPEPESLSGNQLTTRSAFSIRTRGTSEPVFGALWADARVSTDRDRRIVSLSDLKVTRVKFSDETDSLEIIRLTSIVKTELQNTHIDLSLDDVLASIKNEKNSNDSGFNNDPPEIIFRTTPAVLISLDGSPKYAAVENTGFERVMNTASLLFRDPGTDSYYLYGNDHWYHSADYKKEWRETNDVPKSLRQFRQQLMNEPAGKLSPAEEDLLTPASNEKPEIIVREQPAELLYTNGQPDWKSIEGTHLLYARNTDQNLFEFQPEQRYFLLLSGRWYTSNTLDGNWKYVPPVELPADFGRIPEGHAKDEVLASVPGTNAAQEAVIDAQVPQTATINRAAAKCTVTYDGSPEFNRIAGTTLDYAINSETPVVRDGNNYYACDNGVWFWSEKPEGPWVAATAIPSEVRDIPPSCPIYRVKYVYIYDYTPDVIYVGYTAGYLGCFVSGPTIVYGTGWYYPGWYALHYHPYPFTYGFNLHYDPWTGWCFGYSYLFGGPDAWLLWNWGPQPYIGWYGGWWGPYYYAPFYYRPAFGGYYGPRGQWNGGNTTRYERRSSGNVYGPRGRGVGSTSPSRRTGIEPSGVRTGPRSKTNKLLPRPDIRNNVYSDPSGAIYRREGNEWIRGSGTGGQRDQRPVVVPPSAPSIRNLDQQEINRGRGVQRNEMFRNFTIPGGVNLPRGTSKPTIRAPRK